jgi:hypothetical protein
VYTTTRSIVFEPLKSICTSSGYAFAVASFQPPPAPHTAPLRSPLFTALTGYALLYWLDAVATAPTLASATLLLPTGPVIPCVNCAPDGAFAASPL